MIVEQHFASGLISPLEVLGKNARSAAEAQRYAQKYITMQKEQINKASEWAIRIATTLPARHEMAHQMVSESDVITNFLEEGDVDTSVFYQRMQDEKNETMATTQGSLDRRVRFFIDLEDCANNCDSIWSTIKRNLDRGNIYSGIDVVFSNNSKKPSTEQISAWAQGKGIDPDQVKAGAITLNLTNSRYTRILGLNSVPVAIETTGMVIKK